MQTFQI